MTEILFTEIIKASEIGKGGAYIEIPFSVEEKFEKKGRIKVKCFFENIEYRGSLVKMGTQCHIIGITKEILKKTDKKIGDPITVRMIEDIEDRIININPNLKAEFDKNLSLKINFEKLSYTKRKEINESINSAKKEETLKSRLKKIIEELT